MCVLMSTRTGAQVLSPQAEGQGDAGVASLRIWGASANPAVSLPEGKRFGAQAFGATPFDLTGLSRLGLDVGLQNKAGTMGFTLGAQHTAPPGFTLSAIRVGASRRLSESLQIGLRVGGAFADYSEVYGQEIVAIAEGGIRYRVRPNFHAAAEYSYAQREIYPITQRRLRVGVEYASSRRLSILLAASQTPLLPLGVHVGLDYRPAERLNLALGYQSLGQRLSLSGRYVLAGGVEISTGIGVYGQLPMHGYYGVGWVQ